jgi:AcrR family transcriptional regulator
MDPGTSRRALQADATRAAIIASARRLFAERGFGATSVADIARDAGVAVPTVYKSAGGKQAILHALVDAVDAEGGIPEGRAAMMAATDAPAMLHAGVALTRRLHEQAGDVIAALVSASSSDADARAAIEEGERRHRRGMTILAGRMAEAGGLRDGVGADDAATALIVVTARDSYRQLTGAMGWSFDRAQEWMERTLAELLLSD